jgi:endonuclease/exonuclease/phosphatase family metal-dependent hydrolase
VRLLVRTWNLFHGRSFPESGETYLDEMVALAAQDGPDVVCLQEVPAWALPELEAWSGMNAVGAIAMPAIGGRLARRVTALDPRRLRSALTGQANAVLIAPRLTIVEAPKSLPLNPRAVRRREAERLGLSIATRVAWSRNRRVAQVVRIAVGGETAVIVNLHLSSLLDSRPTEAELLRAVTYADGFARPEEPLVLAGDFNLTAASSLLLTALRYDWGFSEAAGGIDHVLARGLTIVRGPAAWPEERRRRGELLLSDHAPVEVEMIGP